MTNDTVAFNRLADLLRDRGEPTLYRGGKLRTRGLCHEGDAPDTVAVSRGQDGKLLIYCHKCQGNTDFLAAIGWNEADLYDTPLDSRDRPAGRGNDDWVPCTPKQGHRKIAEYLYRDEHGTVVHGATRCDHKCFAQWRPDPSTRSGRRWSLNAPDGTRLVPLVPYRLPEILKAIAADTVVWIAEGEKDVHALVDHGLEATCNAAGAGKWTAEHAAYLKGADVTIVADRDKVGKEHAQAVVKTLRGIARSVYVVQAREGKDAHDHFAAGHDTGNFLQVWVPIPYPGDPQGAL